MSIIRAHEACFDGYRFQYISEDEVPRVITIFSAPNYCDVYKNKAACIKFHDDNLNIRQYTSSPHPYYLPNFMDVITWSLPFISEKVGEMLNGVLTHTVEELEELDKATPLAEDTTKMSIETKVQRRTSARIIDKIRAMSKMVRYFSVIKDESENIAKLKALTPSGMLPAGILSQGSAAIAKQLAEFTKAQKADKNNEKLPGDMDIGKKKPRNFFRG